MRVSVIIPTYDRPASLRRVLSSIAGQRLAATQYEVLVVDDGSDPPIALSDVTVPFHLAVLRQPHQGPTAARNLAAARSRGEVLVFLDDDVCIAERTLESMADGCPPGIDVIALGTLLTPEGVGHSVFARLAAAREREHVPGPGGREVSFTQCKTGLLGIRRDAFAALGGFQDPTGGWPNWDDVDFGYRAFQRGFLFRQLDGAVGEHWDYALADLDTACERWQRAARSAVALFRTHPDLQPRLPMFDDKTPLSRRDPPRLLLRKLARRAMARPPVLAALKRTAALLERRSPTSALLPALYRWIVGTHMYIGFQQGLTDRAEGRTRP